VDLLVRTRCILDGAQIWWDVRPHPRYLTLEYRVCDIPMRAEETLTIAALFQAITAKLALLRLKNLAFRPYRRALIMENKWRAARWGTKAFLIDFGKQEEVPMASLLEELLEFVDEVVDDLGCREQVARARRIVEEGTGAERQLAVFHETGNLEAVVDYVVEETESDLSL
jgi:glutamate---cysteine ligase / carboxylate-amine ligase